jgi:tetratricopeptide (TPR) repeat protein
MEKPEQNAYREANRLLDAGKYREALELAETIGQPELRAAILIDAGFAVSKSGPIREGITLYEDALRAPKSLFSRGCLLYNAANGYSALYTLRRRTAAALVPPNDENLRRAKRLFREALAEKDGMSADLRPEMWVNYGNCLAQLGRGIEAIDCYQRALTEEPTNGMATGNLGVELEHVAEITGRYVHHYLLAAHAALSQAVGSGMHLRYGTPRASEELRERLQNLNRRIDALGMSVHPLKASETTNDNPQTSEYVRFCLDHQLFLNAWVGDANVAPAITDEIAFTPITTALEDNETVPALLRTFNECKEAYATARYLLYLFHRADPTLDAMSRLTFYFDMDQRELHGLYVGLCKTAYARAFDVLDKVARIVNIYFGIGRTRDTFWNVLAEKQSLGESHATRFGVRPGVAKTGNFSLYALADLCIDYFESEHVDFKTIDSRRNHITHDHLAVRGEEPGKAASSDQELTAEELENQTLEILKLAKSSILYAVSAVHLAERKKGKRPTTEVRYKSAPGNTGDEMHRTS